MKIPLYPLLATLIAAVGVVAGGCQITRAGYATAPYRILTEDGRVQIRAYPALELVETPSGGDDFMRLFRYISSSNSAREKIAMTTPVFMTGMGTTNAQMAFVLPEALTHPPEPTGERVGLRRTEPSTFAVLRFRGGRQGPDGEALRQLKAWLAKNDRATEGEPVFAYFDPPWIPGFLRRNEVMLRTVENNPARTP